jgi:putative transcriptional regulator
MSIQHHPDDATLMAFAAGTLSEPFAVVVSAHLEMCGQCRKTARRMNTLGAALMQKAEAAALTDGEADRLLSALDAAPAQRRRPLPPAPPAGSGLPQTLARLLGGGMDRIAWRQIVPGAEDHLVKFANRDGVHTLRFLRAGPGMALPEHAHVGTELTLVLQGALKDGDAIYRSGDITDMDDQGTHTPTVHGDEICICAIANEAPPRFRQLRFKILQKMIGI